MGQNSSCRDWICSKHTLVGPTLVSQIYGAACLPSSRMPLMSGPLVYGKPLRPIQARSKFPSWNCTRPIVTIPMHLWQSGQTSGVRTVWIDGAQDIDAVTAGLIILAPLTNSNDTTRSALGCSIDARWDESHHVQSDGPLDIAISADVVGQRHDDSGGSGFLPANNSDWKNIKATTDWLEALTPTVPYLSSTLDLTNPASTIANLFMSTGHTNFPPIESVENGYGDNPYQFWESVIATYFAEGVARVGYSQQLESPVFFVERSSPGTDQCNISIPVVWHNVDICPEDRPKGVNLTAFSLQGQITGSKFPQFNPS